VALDRNQLRWPWRKKGGKVRLFKLDKKIYVTCSRLPAACIGVEQANPLDLAFLQHVTVLLDRLENLGSR
jgi:hypothetical protein